MNQLLPKSDLLIQFQVQDFVIKTQKQIAKDFIQSGIDFPSEFQTEELAYDEIVGAVQNELMSLMQFGEARLSQLLYQIDIPQNEYLHLINSPDFLSRLSELIIRREAYKVFLRAKF